MRKRAAVVGLGLAAALALPLGAQQADLPPVRAAGGIQAMGAAPVGEFADNIEGGGGLGINIVWPVQRDGWFALRAEGGWILYGEETKNVCFGGGVGCRVTLDLTTTNNIAWLSAGPQLMAPRGAVRPYANVQGGFAYFATTSSLKGDDSQHFASDTNFDDFTLAWTAGGGLLIPLSRGRVPVSLDLGAQYHGNGSVEYLKEGDIHDNPDGSISYDATRSQADFVSIRLGVTIGIRPHLR